MATAPVIAVLAVQRRILLAFRKAGATAPSLARTASELGVKENRMFRLMVRDGYIVAAGRGYYLDEPRYGEHNRRRQKFALIIVAVVVVVLAVAIIIAKR